MTCSDEVNTVSGYFNLIINDVPQATVLPAQTILQSQPMTYTLPGNVFTDFDSGSITSSALPPGITFNTATKTFSGTPTTAGATTVTLTATDKYGATNTTMITFTVRGNVAPVFNPNPLTNKQFNVGSTVSYAIASTDADGDAMTITYENGPAWLNFASPTQSNNTAIAAIHAGNWSVAMKVCDTWNACTVNSFVLWIN